MIEVFLQSFHMFEEIFLLYNEANDKEHNSQANEYWARDQETRIVPVVISGDQNDARGEEYEADAHQAGNDQYSFDTGRPWLRH